MVDFIGYKISQTENRLKAKTKRRTTDAHAIALNIVNENRERPRGEVEKMIKDALRPISCKNTCESFFATSLPPSAHNSAPGPDTLHISHSLPYAYAHPVYH